MSKFTHACVSRSERFAQINNKIRTLLQSEKGSDFVVLVDTIESEQATPSLSQAQRLKRFSQDGHLNEDSMLATMSEKKKPEKNDLSIKANKLQKYFPKSYTPQQMEQVIIRLLDGWQKNGSESRSDNTRRFRSFQNEEVIKGQIKELVRGSVEETLNNRLLEEESKKHPFVLPFIIFSLHIIYPAQEANVREYMIPAKGVIAQKGLYNYTIVLLFHTFIEKMEKQ